MAAVTAVDDVAFSVRRRPGLHAARPVGLRQDDAALRCIAGLERPDAGAISLNGKELFNAQTGAYVPPDKRGIRHGLPVLRDLAAHERIRQCRISSTHREAAAPRDPGPGELGARHGPAWRIRAARLHPALGRPAAASRRRPRAGAGNPGFCLLDEPLSNLDAKLREEMREELKRLQSALDLTMLYVTHDQAEAIVLSDRIAVMSEGRILQEGPPREIYQRPRSPFVAGFVGNSNLLDGDCRGRPWRRAVSHRDRLRPGQRDVHRRSPPGRGRAGVAETGAHPPHRCPPRRRCRQDGVGGNRRREQVLRRCPPITT